EPLSIVEQTLVVRVVCKPVAREVRVEKREGLGERVGLEQPGVLGVRRELRAREGQKSIRATH
ncbi:MAG TPA: hypothetical protein PLV85_18250, partial [Polyangiaceae bacterium]|nr:hypothetical protein [Polyangiaceae bacterium]